MKTQNYTVTILTASEGHKLTQAADIDIKSRFIVSQVALGANDSIENWKEITDAEAAAIEEEIRAAHEAPVV